MTARRGALGMRLITEPEDVEFVLRQTDYLFGKTPELLQYQGMLLAGSVLNLDGEDHFQRRRIEARVFTSDRLAYYENEVLEPYLDAAVADLAREAERTGGTPSVDLVAVVRRALVGVVAAVIGLDGVDSPEAVAQLDAILEALNQGVKVDFRTDGTKEAKMEEVLARRAEFVDRFFGPSLARRQALVKAHIADPEGNPPPAPDLLTVLASNPDHVQRWDEGLPLREATLFAQASIGTTTRGVCHTVVELERWLEQHPEDRARLTDPEFLGRAFAESLRLHAIDPALQRKAWQDVTLPSGEQIPKDEILGVDIGASGRDTSLFGADANLFNPHRQRPESLDAHGHSFGGGSHKCTGFNFVVGDRYRADRQGTAKTILLRLYSLGIRLDPERPPVRDHGTVKDDLRAVPVIFSALRGARSVVG